MTRTRSQSPFCRAAVAARATAAVFGGYALAALSVATFALLSGAPREEAVAVATLPAFAIHLLAVIWAFAASTAARAWLGVGGPALALGLLFWWLRAAAMAS